MIITMSIQGGKTHYLLYENWMVIHLNKLESPSPKDALWQVCLKLVQWFLRNFFFISSMYFCYVVIISHWKRAGPFIWTNLNLLHRRMLCDNFVWNWSSGYWGEDFLNFVNVFLVLRNFLPLEKSRVLHLNKFGCPSPKDALCHVWLKLFLWFLRRRYF